MIKNKLLLSDMSSYLGDVVEAKKDYYLFDSKPFDNIYSLFVYAKKQNYFDEFIKKHKKSIPTTEISSYNNILYFLENFYMFIDNLPVTKQKKYFRVKENVVSGIIPLPKNSKIIPEEDFSGLVRGYLIIDANGSVIRRVTDKGICKPLLYQNNKKEAELIKSKTYPRILTTNIYVENHHLRWLNFFPQITNVKVKGRLSKKEIQSMILDPLYLKNLFKTNFTINKRDFFEILLEMVENDENIASTVYYNIKKINIYEDVSPKIAYKFVRFKNKVFDEFFKIYDAKAKKHNITKQAQYIYDSTIYLNKDKEELIYKDNNGKEHIRKINMKSPLLGDLLFNILKQSLLTKNNEFLIEQLKFIIFREIGQNIVLIDKTIFLKGRNISIVIDINNLKIRVLDIKDKNANISFKKALVQPSPINFLYIKSLFREYFYNYETPLFDVVTFLVKVLFNLKDINIPNFSYFKAFVKDFTPSHKSYKYKKEFNLSTKDISYIIYIQIMFLYLFLKEYKKRQEIDTAMIRAWKKIRNF